jgi:DNA (cytosine-5)-methyltransferase 1
VSALNVLSLFSGIGGLELGLERAGMTVVGQVEIDPFCRRVLAKHWPEVPRHDDVRTCVEWWRSQPRPAVHLVAGGPPCQPSSDAGPRLADRDERWMWPEFAAVVAAIRPDWVIAENVPGLLDRGIDLAVGYLRDFGYEPRVGLIPACALGAPHPRERVFILAHPEGEGRCPWGAVPGTPAASASDGSAWDRPERRAWWTGEPDVGRVAYGVPEGVDRRRALGNAIVPQVAQHIGELILAADQGAAA